MATTAPAQAGTLLQIECELMPVVRKPFQAVALVAWTRTEAAPAGPAGMGLKFVRIEGGSQAQLNACLSLLGPVLVPQGQLARASENSGRRSMAPRHTPPPPPPSPSGRPTPSRPLKTPALRPRAGAQSGPVAVPSASGVQVHGATALSAEGAPVAGVPADEGPVEVVEPPAVDQSVARFVCPPPPPEPIGEVPFEGLTGQVLFEDIGGEEDPEAIEFLDLPEGVLPAPSSSEAPAAIATDAQPSSAPDAPVPVPVPVPVPAPASMPSSQVPAIAQDPVLADTDEAELETHDWEWDIDLDPHQLYAARRSQGPAVEEPPLPAPRRDEEGYRPWQGVPTWVLAVLAGVALLVIVLGVGWLLDQDVRSRRRLTAERASQSQAPARPRPSSGSGAAVPRTVPLPAKSAPPAAEEESESGPKQYEIVVKTWPAGATVYVGQLRLTSPAQLKLLDVPSGLSIRAELPGYHSVATVVRRSMFEQEGNVLRATVNLDLVPGGAAPLEKTGGQGGSVTAR